MKRLAHLKARRKLWLQVHLYFGLFAGAILVIIGLTGSILVFWHEIDSWLNPDLYQVEMSKDGAATQRPLAEMIAAAQAAMPAGAKLGNIYYPHWPGTAFIVSFAPAETVPGEYEYLEAFVDPYTVKVQGTRIFYSAANPFDNCFVGLMLKLHYNLLLGDTPGVTIVGILAVLLLISVLTGLILWWPLTGKWRQAFTWKRHASAERFSFDLHKTTGVYAALVLLAVLFSGVYFNLMDEFVWLVSRFSPATDIYKLRSKSQRGVVSITPDEAIAVATRLYSEGRITYIGGLVDTAGAYRVCWKEVPPCSATSSMHAVWLLINTAVRSCYTYDPASGTAGDVFIQWQWPLHSGQAFGVTGRILVCLSGIACPVLYITGFIRWRQKKRSERHRAARPRCDGAEKSSHSLA